MTFSLLFYLRKQQRRLDMYKQILKDLKKLYRLAQKESNLRTAVSIKKLELQIQEKLEKTKGDRPCKIPPIHDLSNEDIEFFLQENGVL
jgi:hypothetical protein